MSSKVKTKYQLYNGQLHYEGNPTEIHIVDDNFFRGKKPINIYQEDGHIFAIKPVLPFFNWLKFSAPTGQSIDKEGFIWSKNQNCVFDEYINSD